MPKSEPAGPAFIPRAWSVGCVVVSLRPVAGPLLWVWGPRWLRRVCRHGVGCVSFRFLANTETYLKDTALKHMPPNLQKVDLLRTGEQNIRFTLFP